MRGALALGLALMASAAGASCRPDLVTLRGGFGEAAIRVAIADDAAERARGLMFVESMPAFDGMLFVYEEPQAPSFYMRNTLIPLDMIFADATGTVTRIHENAVPLDLTPIPGGEGVRFVLEVNGGLSRRLGLDVGDALQHPAVGEGAALPCG